MRTISRLSRRQFLAAAGAASLAGCTTRGGPGGGDSTRGSSGGESDPTDSPTATPPADRRPDPSAVPTADERLPLPGDPDWLRGEARSGGPPKDGIPSIDAPQFLAPSEVDYLDAGDPVFGAVRDGVAKAYPQKILVSHEIVNDDLAGLSVAVTYCPLTGTVQGFERGETTFGVSGRLINNNLVMYDRETEAWWPQILATAIPSPWNPDPEIRSLREFRLIWTTWERWRDRHPDTLVLSTDTGYARNYDRDPYGSYNPIGGYYTRKSTLFGVLNEDDRYHPKRIFMGARTPDGAAAFLKDAVRSKKVMEGRIGDAPVVAVYDPRYDTAYVYENSDRSEFAFRRGELVAPDGTRYAPDDLPLSRIHTFDAMWFAWAGYYPETAVYE